MHVGEPLFADVTGIQNDSLGTTKIESRLVDVEKECSLSNIKNSISGMVEGESIVINSPDEHGEMRVSFSMMTRGMKKKGLKNLMTNFSSGLSDAQENCPSITLKGEISW